MISLLYAVAVIETVPASDPDREAATEVLMAASRLMTAVVARTMGAVDESVSVPQLRVMVMLSRAAPMNLTAVAQGLGVNASNASRTIDKLVTSGLVARDADPVDRRQVSLALTASGLQLVQSLMAARRAILDEIVGQLKPVEQRRLTQALGAFLAADESGPNPSSVDGESLVSWIR